jgi:hypothetical protein
VSAPSRPVLLAAAALVLVAAAVAVVVAVLVLPARARDDQRPPPPQAGVIRLGTPAKPNLPAPQQPVRRRDGSTALLSMTGLDRQGGRLVGHVGVRDGFQGTVLDLGEGESGEAYGVRIRVVHLWSLPNPVHDAIDVTVT